MDNKTSTGTGTSTGTASYTYTINPPRQYGWVCPLCGRANAPWMSQCTCKPVTVLKSWASTNPDLQDVTYVNAERNN